MFPSRTPMEREIPIYRAFLHISRNPHKNSSKYIFFFLKGAKIRAPLLALQSGVLWKQTPVSRVLLNISFGVPSKGALPRVPFMESLGERCPVPRALLHSSFKVPGIRAPLQIPGSLRSSRGPYWERCQYLEPFLTSSRTPVKEFPHTPRPPE
jgi:hypothetical protein